MQLPKQKSNSYIRLTLKYKIANYIFAILYYLFIENYKF